MHLSFFFFFFSSRRRHTRLTCDWSSDVCSSDLIIFYPSHYHYQIMFGIYINDINSISQDRKSTRLNSSHMSISYAVFCLKKKKKKKKKKKNKKKTKTKKKK